MKSLVCPLDRNASLRESIFPEINRRPGDGKGDVCELADAMSAHGRIRPREESKDRTRMSRPITVIKMIGARVIKIDGHFN